MLNSPSLAKSVVGLAVKLVGVGMCLLLYLPLMIRIQEDIYRFDIKCSIECAR